MKSIFLSLICLVAVLTTKAQNIVTVTNNTGCTICIYVHALDPATGVVGGTKTVCIPPSGVKVFSGPADFTPALTGTNIQILDGHANGTPYTSGPDGVTFGPGPSGPYIFYASPCGMVTVNVTTTNDITIN